MLATGGVGGLWQSTTNPVGARGAGVALAARAGAILADLEFMQFHPTALAVGVDPMPLISEAVRGEGAVLVDAGGNRFMAGTPGGDLAPRDVVARAVFAEWATDGGSAALDVRHFAPGAFAKRFPTINRVLGEYGLDPERTPIPVRPATHYHMGGVKVGSAGRQDQPCRPVGGRGGRLHRPARRQPPGASNSRCSKQRSAAALVAEDIAGRGDRRVTVAMPPDRIRRGIAPAGENGASRSDDHAQTMNRDVGVVRDAAGPEPRRSRQARALLRQDTATGTAR